MSHLRTQTLGYPRIGKNREMKRALEAYWKGQLDVDALWQTFWDTAEERWQDQLDAGIDYIGVGDMTLYDHTLDWAVRFGLIPSRFHALTGLERYFAMARGAPDIPALEMTKWFDTNYHYLVPEVETNQPTEGVPTLKPDFVDFLALIKRAQAKLGERAVPIVLGPLTLLHLSRLQMPMAVALDALLPLYVQLLTDLKAMNVPEVQIHEPVLVLGLEASAAAALETLARKAYAAMAEADVPLNLVTYFDDLDTAVFSWVVGLPVDVITLDFTRGDTLTLLQSQGGGHIRWPAGKTLAAGLVDGRSVWRMRPHAIARCLDALRDIASLRVSVSSSLQFVPYAAARETELPTPLRGVLAFAEEKLVELASLGHGALESAKEAWTDFYAFAPSDVEVHAKVQALTDDDFSRALSYQERRALQIQLPLLPTTTIGSFPQTREVRRLRSRYRRGEITETTYHAGVDAFIAYTIGVQEGLGLDVLVHGEFERSDMVEYFAQKMQGFAFTLHGWVQSFGSRYVRPPIIYADIARPTQMTVRAFEVAQAFTPKPVKGMLTGPVTILNWSYPRVDVSKREIAFQIALALREEIADLEAAGARVVQVDEPALREGLPLKPDRWETYLDWAVDAFKLATGCAKPETQVHTHMCYSEFGDILEAIDALDADVISIENARSDDATLRELARCGYAREVGPGVYDIHSPVIPSVDFIVAKLRMFLKHLKPEQIWVNPDCGLKTRAWDEVIPALRNLMKAVRITREELESLEEGG
jgi:5-methyltetrahydropteroyltriglutamate--homocysteine methyltransferase